MDHVLDKLKRCDRDKPYIFISYSSVDREPVWRDVLRFQQMGYNVWLDEKDVDKTSSSWRSEALGAIRDINCELVLFYVSSNSLVSKPCFDELSCTEDENTRDIHFGAVKFVAVDLEPIGDIMQFGKALHQKVRSELSVAKEVRTERAATITRCLKQFFSSEKIRVRPIDSPNRKRDYYEELCGIFPSEACISPALPEAEPDIQKSTSKPELPAASVTPVEIKPESEKSPEPQEAQLPEPQLPAAAEPVPPLPETKETDNCATAPQTVEAKPDPALTDGIDWTAVAELAMDNANAVLKSNNSYCIFKRTKYCKQKQIANALYNITKKHASANEVLGLLDSSLMGSGKSGMMVTSRMLFLREFLLDTLSIDLTDVMAAESNRDDNILQVTYRDGTKQDYFVSTLYTSALIAYLQTYIDINRHLMQLRLCRDLRALLEKSSLKECVGTPLTEA